jgi:hypothetical protein
LVATMSLRSVLDEVAVVGAKAMGVEMDLV